MARKEIKGPINDSALNNTNHNFIELYNEYRAAGLNAEDARRRAIQAVISSEYAQKLAYEANITSEQLRKELNSIIIDSGTSDAETIQARGSYSVLNDRLNSNDESLSRNEERSFYRSLFNHKVQKPSITWIDDDAVKIAFERLAPIARMHNIPMTFAVITSRFGNDRFLSKEDVTEAYREGFEIVDHSYAHDNDKRPTDMTTEELRADLSLSKEIWKSMGIPNNIHVIPFGANTPSTQRVYRELFECSIMTTMDGTGGSDGRGVPNHLPLDNYRLGRVAYPAPLEHIQAQIDNAASNNGWVIIMSHMSVDNFDEEKVNNIISYAKEKGLEWITAQEGLNRFGNIANFGELGNYGGNVIQADGSVSGDIGSHITTTFTRNLTPNADITHFAKNAVTYDRISNPRSVDFGLPKNLGGTLHTFRAEDDRYSYQVHAAWVNSERRIRNWNVENNQWGEWTTNTPIRTYEREVSGRFIEANSSYMTTINISNATSDDVFIANPNGVMPIGVLWNVQFRDGVASIRITNTNPERRYLDTMTWKIKHILYR